MPHFIRISRERKMFSSPNPELLQHRQSELDHGRGSADHGISIPRIGRHGPSDIGYKADMALPPVLGFVDRKVQTEIPSLLPGFGDPFCRGEALAFSPRR